MVQQMSTSTCKKKILYQWRLTIFFGYNRLKEHNIYDKIPKKKFPDKLFFVLI